MQDLNVVPFSIYTVANRRLTQQDKIDAWSWEETALSQGYDRVVVQARAWVRGVEQDEFVLVYRLGHPWARWGTTRQRNKIMVWRCSDGAERGHYSTMKSALHDLPHASSAHAIASADTQILCSPHLLHVSGRCGHPSPETH